MGLILGRQIMVPQGVPLPISKGGTGEITAPTALNALLPPQEGNEGKGLHTNGVVVSWKPLSMSATSIPGVDKQVLFNDNGTFGASTLLFDKITDSLTVSGNIFPEGIVNIGTSDSRFNDLYLSKGAHLTAISETIVDGGNTGTGIITPNASLGTIYEYVATGNFTLNTVSNAVPGTTMTLIVRQDSIGKRILSSTMLFPDGNKKLSTLPDAIDIVSIMYDGVNYYAVISKNYGAIMTAYYSITVDKIFVDEGGEVIATVTTFNVPSGTILYWTTNGTVSSGDFANNSDIGSFVVYNNTGSFIIAISEDLTTEGTEAFSIDIRTSGADGEIVATSELITINDTSLTPQYFTSLVYPLMFEDTFGLGIASIQQGNMFPILDDKLSLSVPPFISGTLEATIVYQSYDKFNTDKLSLSVPPFISGTLEATIVYQSYDKFNTDKLSLSVPPFISGTLDTAINYISYVNWPKESVSLPIASIIGGTLA